MNSEELQQYTSSLDTNEYQQEGDTDLQGPTILSTYSQLGVCDGSGIGSRPNERTQDLSARPIEDRLFVLDHPQTCLDTNEDGNDAEEVNTMADSWINQSPYVSFDMTPCSSEFPRADSLSPHSWISSRQPHSSLPASPQKRPYEPHRHPVSMPEETNVWKFQRPKLARIQNKKYANLIPSEDAMLPAPDKVAQEYYSQSLMQATNPTSSETNQSDVLRFSMRPKFTIEEDLLLFRLREDEQLSWATIAKFYPTRSAKSLQAHHLSNMKVLSQQEWPRSVDRQLLALVYEHEKMMWELVSKRLGLDYSATSCRARYISLCASQRRAVNEFLDGEPSETNQDAES